MNIGYSYPSFLPAPSVPAPSDCHPEERSDEGSAVAFLRPGWNPGPMRGCGCFYAMKAGISTLAAHRLFDTVTCVCETLNGCLFSIVAENVSRAEVAELADAHGSGPCTRKGVGVRVPSSAPFF